MAPETRQRISYVLPLPDAGEGHRLGVNGLALDSEQSILYSGGRDGLICAWSIDANTRKRKDGSETQKSTESGATLRTQVQAHSHWVNDIILAQSNSALVSASSDVTVKLWRPQSDAERSPTTIGVHSDYVKCLASPALHSDWVASGGLDHQIRLWDLYGGGERLRINVADSEKSAKTSIYALSARGSILASGGPESIVRLWDSRNGKRITSFVGHTDNIRDVLLNQDGDMVMTASSDRSIKVWSVTAGRCMYTLTMHNDSVWSLHSDHPRLSLFYSSDRAGLVAKTDVRHSDDMDEGRTIAICKEQQGVTKVVASEKYIWTATSTSSINCWPNVDTTSELQFPDAPKPLRVSSIASRARAPSSPRSNLTFQPNAQKPKIPITALLRISNNAPLPGQNPMDPEASTIYSVNSSKKYSEALLEYEDGIVTPCLDLPEYTIVGQYGLIKQIILNDRRRVLTLDTTGEVGLWDLLRCSLIKLCGKRALDEVRNEVDLPVSIANWCTIDIHTGRIMVTLDKNFCFDAETYADELDIEDSRPPKDDQRLNLGRWILRSLFATLIDLEAERDVEVRLQVSQAAPRSRGNVAAWPPNSQSARATIPQTASSREQDDAVTSRPVIAAPLSPGLSVSVPTVSGSRSLTKVTSSQSTNDLGVSEGRASLERRSEENGEALSPSRTANDKGSALPSNIPSNDNAVDGSLATSTSESKDDKGGSSLFSKKFRMTFPKKLGRSSAEVKVPVADERIENPERPNLREETSYAQYMQGTLDEIRAEYEGLMLGYSSFELESAIVPSLTTDTPLLRPPGSTTIIIQEDSSDLGAVVDRYRGQVNTVGQDAGTIKLCAPRWLGDLLLRNRIPEKELGKISFVLQPFQNLLPGIASADGNTRLTANRMLRARKVLAYVAEKIEDLPTYPEHEDLKPEEYLELYCQDQLIEHNMTLGTIRAHIWKTGGDITLYYKSNGKKPSIEGILAKRRAALSAAEVAGKVGPTITSTTS